MNILFIHQPVLLILKWIVRFLVKFLKKSLLNTIRENPGYEMKRILLH